VRTQQFYEKHGGKTSSCRASFRSSTFAPFVAGVGQMRRGASPHTTSPAGSPGSRCSSGAVPVRQRAARQENFGLVTIGIVVVSGAAGRVGLAEQAEEPGGFYLRSENKPDDTATSNA
jgi:hypothetical protein